MSLYSMPINIFLFLSLNQSKKSPFYVQKCSLKNSWKTKIQILRHEKNSRRCEKVLVVKWLWWISRRTESLRSRTSWPTKLSSVLNLVFFPQKKFVPFCWYSKTNESTLKENLSKVKHFFDEENVERKLFFDNNDSYVEYIGDVFECGNRQQSRDRARLGP